MQILRNLGYRLAKRFLPRPLVAPVTITDLIALATSLKGSALKILQIGAYDGKSFDPVYEVTSVSEAEIILVEANPDAIPRLETNYPNRDGVEIVHGAVIPGSKKQTVELFKFSDEAVKTYPEFGGTSSILETHLFRAFERNQHRFPNGTTAKSLIESDTVPVISPASLVESHRLADVDILIVDVEGMDWPVVRGFLEAGCDPAALFYESRFMGIAEMESALAFLRDRGYAPVDFGLDTGAIKFPTRPN